MDYQYNLELKKFCPSFIRRLMYSKHALQDMVCVALRVVSGCPNIDRLQDSVRLLTHEFPCLKLQIISQHQNHGHENISDDSYEYDVVVVDNKDISINLVEDFEYDNFMQCIQHCMNGSFALDEPLLRLQYYSQAEQDKVLVICAHRMVIDEKRMCAFVEKLFDYYNTLINAEDPDKLIACLVKEIPPRYAEQLNAEENDSRIPSDLEFWRNTLVKEHLSEQSDISHCRENTLIDVSLDRFSTTRLNGWCLDNAVKLSEFFVVLWQVVLHGAFGESCIGLQIDRQIANDIGIFNPSDVILLPSVESNTLTPDIIRLRSQLIQESRRHLSMTFEQILAKLGQDNRAGILPVRSIVRFTLCHSLGFSCDDGARFYLEQVLAAGENNGYLKTISANFYLREGKIIGSLGFSDQAYDPSVVDALWSRFCDEVNRIIQHPTSLASSASSNDELHVMFEKAAQTFSKRVALINQPYGKSAETLTYSQLNKAANRLANTLIDQGVKHGDHVAVYCDRSHLSFIALLAIWKAGAIYVPFDVVQTRETLQDLVRQSQPVLILTNFRRHGLLYNPEHVIPELLLESALSEQGNAKEQNPQRQHSPDQPSLLLFTSGSTGAPKGVMHKQRQLINRFEWLWSKYPFEEDDVACQRTNLGYQPSIWEMFGGLLKGIPTVILHDDIVKDPYLFKDALIKHKVTHATLVPSLLQLLLQDSDKNQAPWKHLRTCITVGEPLKVELLRRFKHIAPNTLLINDYGSTETNGVLYFDSRDIGNTTFETLPGFRCIDNVSCHVLNEDLQAVSPGETGVLYVGGESLAIGYLNNPELTAEKFIHHVQLNRRLYCIGDLARLRDDDTIDILGRSDNQVKIRGNRVELEGLENILQSCDGVVDCAVGVRTLTKDVKKLVAYIVLHDDVAVDSVRSQLGIRVPDYMQPSFYRQVTKIPRNANGKVDRSQINEDNSKSLDERAQGVQSAETNRTMSKVSSALGRMIQLTADILEIPCESIDPRRKFYEIGFDSTTIVLLAQSIKSELQVEVRVAELYNIASLSSLAEHLDKLTGDGGNNYLCSSDEVAEIQAAVTASEDSSAQQSVIQVLRQVAAELLEVSVDEIDVQRKFYELGFDSGTGAEYIQRVNSDLGIELRIKDMYANAILDDLAAYIEQTFARELQGQKVQVTNDRQITSKSAELLGSSSISERFIDNDEPIAIIGMSGSYAHYRDLANFWEGLSEGKSAIREVPLHRWDATKLYSEDSSIPGATVSKWGGFLDCVDRFDAEFFGIMPSEALYMDPQQRLSLQEGWRTFENAGYSEEAISGCPVGIFVGHRAGDYVERVREHVAHANAYTLMGNDSAVLAARLAYHLNLKGPCISLDTACSSSLVAIHLACQSLRSGECDMALAGGVCVLTTPTLYQQSTKLGMLTNEGKCKTFDNRADGFVPGEGVGFVLLKTLTHAIRDDDTIHAVIIGSGVNQDGRTNGMVAPNARSQQALIEKVCRDYHIDPQSIGLVETHGTGTKLGDPIEFEALKGAYAQDVSAKDKCALGAVKANIGHTIAASGIAGLHKSILAMQQQKIPPVINFEQINEHIDIDSSPFFINTQLKDWSVKHGQKRRAAISSFGFSGTNAHVVIEEYPQKVATNSMAWRHYLIALSAKSANSLYRKVDDFARFLEQHPTVSLANVEKTLWVGRSHYAHRHLFVASDAKDLIAQLRSFSGENKTDYYQLPEQFVVLADAYMVGKAIQWEQYKIAELFGEAKRICLPTYPFDEKRFWLDYHADANNNVQQPDLPPINSVEPPIAVTNTMSDAQFIMVVEDAVRKVIQEVTGYDAYSLKTEEPLEKIGIGSAVILMLNRAMKDRFGELPHTLFYENQSIGDLACCLSTRFKAQTEKALGWESTPQDSNDLPRDQKSFVLESERPRLKSVANPNLSVRELEQSQKDIAIIGLSGRYPKANNIDEFWRNLCEGKDCITEVPRNRWQVDDIYRPDSKEPGYVNSKWGGFLDDVEAFDPLFFNISPKDAQLQDPQERLFLQTAWHALEDAGYCKQTLANRKVGVFVGVVWGEYQLFGVEARQKGNHVYPNASFSSIANRVSYCFNLNGPSMAVDTMCSSSLTAIHLACQSIISGECDMAIAGGVNLSLHPTKYQLLAQGRFLSSDGHCRSFAEGGDGYVPGEGVGAVVIKPLSVAINDGDHIYAVVKGSALNHGGKTNGYTVPNPNAQGQLINEALQRAQIDPQTISYIETHGTGTELGDPIEIAGLLQAFPAQSGRRCAIGTVKSNIGHLEAAAGIAGLTKVLLQMKYGLLVPSLLLGRINNKIDFETTPFHLQTQLDPWIEPEGQPRRASISAFGAGGSNAHMILEAYEARDELTRNESEGQHIVILSARQEHQLHRQIEQLLTFLLNIQAPAWTSEKLADCVRMSLAEVLDVDIHHIDLHEALEDYLSDQSDLERFLVKMNDRLPAPISSTVIDTCLPLSDLVAGLFEHCGSLSEVQGRAKYTLANISYTLQVGREPFEHRVAFVAKDVTELVELLKQFLAGQASSAIVAGNILGANVDLSAWLNNATGQDFVKQLVQQKAYRQIAQMWVTGVEVNWQFFYPALSHTVRVPLPLYPFDTTRYWFDQAFEEKSPPPKVTANLHPLLHSNCSNLHEQKFMSQLSAQAFYLDDHRVGSEPTLPGVAYLEMMLAALEYSLDDRVDLLTNVVFVQPIAIGQGTELSKVLVKVVPEDGVLDIRVESEGGDLYSKSLFTWSQENLPSPATIDIESLSKQTHTSLDAQQCYEICLKANMHYKASFRVLNSIEIGDDFVIGYIQLTSNCETDQFRLHPAVMDGGLQTLLVLMDHIKRLQGRNFLPYSIQRVTCFAELPKQCRALVRATNDSLDNPAFDVHYINALSEIVVSIEGLVLREARTARSDNQLLYYQYLWQYMPLPEVVAEREAVVILLLLPSSQSLENIQTIKKSVEGMQHAAVFFAREAETFYQYDEYLFDINTSTLRDYISLFASLPVFPHCIVSLAGLDNPPVAHTQKIATAAMYLAQATAQCMPIQAETGLLFFYREGEVSGDLAVQATFQALGGLAKTVRIETPRLQCRTIALDAQASYKQALSIALDEYQRGEEFVSEIRYTQMGRETKQLAEIPLVESSATSALPSDAVVLITGGMGKLGLICAEWVLTKQKNAVVVLCGRSEPSLEVTEQIDTWRAAGKKVNITFADITSPEQTDALINKIVSEYGKLTGIFHCAGALRDAFLIKKSSADIQAVLAPKLQGTLNLDLASKDCALEYFCLFSSIAAVLGNPGQSDYSYANSYLDNFAHARNILVANGQRYGRSISINWPLWAEGGMHMDRQTQAHLREQWGVVPLPTDLGLSQLDIALRQSPTNFIFVYGHGEKLRQSMHINDGLARYGRNKVAAPKVKHSTQAHTVEEQRQSGASAKSAHMRAKAYVAKLLSDATKVPIENLDEDTSFDRYGVDSIVIADLNSTMEARFDGLPQTLLFEYQSINTLADFLCEHYPESFVQADGGESHATNYSAQANSIYSSGIPKGMSQSFELSRQSKRFITDIGNTAAVAHEDIAIIGMSGRYPKANSLSEFWDNLVAGRDCIEEVPNARWDWQKYFEAKQASPGKTHSKWGGFIDDIDKFDPLFFNISPAEAEQMDPQERLCIELVWQALEDAGYTRASIKRTTAQGRNTATGLFIGCMYKHYPWLAKNAEAGPFLSISSYWNITNRVSYLFDFQGPSIAVDTACASSLTAVHMACENIRQGNCTTAFAGGINLTLHPDKFVGLAKSGMLSSEAKSRGMGRGDGYVSGEGAGVVLLKPLSLAEVDGDHIYAVIKGSAINHGGKSNSFSTPNPRAQTQVVEQALKSAAISADQISYVEMASNGAELGDMIEFNALDSVYRKASQRQNYCAIGTVKSNLGHLEAASGISQLSKVVLQLKHKIIVPSINAEPLNEKISFEGSPFRLQRDVSPWQINEHTGITTRYAAVNSIGAGGANAHVILAEYKNVTTRNKTQQPNPLDEHKAYPILLSARSLMQIAQQAQALAECLREQTHRIIDVAYTLAVGREFHKYRLVIYGNTREKLVDNLRLLAEKLANEMVLTDLGDILAPYAISTPDGISAISAENVTYSEAVNTWLELKNVDWFAVWQGKVVRRVSLPSYPFERNSYWIPGFTFGNKELVSVALSKLSNSAKSPRDVVVSKALPVMITKDRQSQNPHIASFLRKELSNQLKIAADAVDFDQDLSELGFDSLQSMRFLNRLQQYFRKKLTASDLIGVTSIEALAQYLIENGYTDGQQELSVTTEDNFVQDSESAIDAQMLVLLSKLEKGDISPDVAVQEEVLIQQQLLETKPWIK